MKLLLENWKKFLKEGKFAQETLFLYRVLVPHLKNFISSGKESELFTVPEKEIKELNIKNLNNFYLDMFKNSYIKKDFISVSGKHIRGSVDFGAYILIKIEIGNFKPTMWNELLSKVKSTIRHEIEHTSQDITKDNIGYSTTDKLSLKKYENYYTSSFEIEAFVSGFYSEAKRNKVPFEEVVDSYLEKVVAIIKRTFEHKEKKYSEKNLTSLIKRIKGKWLEYAKERYPNAQLKGQPK